MMIRLLELAVIVPVIACGLNCDSERYGCPGGDYEHELISRFRKGCPSEKNDVQCALRRAEEIDLWLSRNNEFKVLITGKMGTGKSALVKGLTEAHDPEVDNLLPHTVKVTPYTYEQDKISLTILDTPGLKDDVNGTNDYSYLKDMVRNSGSQEPNLLIFALRMDEPFRREDMDVINNVTAAFGWKVWKNAMFILTMANKVREESKAPNSRENKVYYARKQLDFKMKITEVLREYKVEDEVADSIPVIPVGLVKQPFILSDDRKKSWVDEFWETVHTCLKASKQDEAAEDTPTPPPPCPTCPPCTPDKEDHTEESSWRKILSWFSSIFGKEEL